MISVVFLSGCVVEEKSPEKYTYEKDNSTYFILYPGSEFVAYYSDGTSASGTYRIADNELILTYRPFGNAIKFRKDGNSFIDDEGRKWIQTK
jgi:hypothetical protein